MEGLGQTAALDLFASEGINDVHVGMDGSQSALDDDHEHDPIYYMETPWRNCGSTTTQIRLPSSNLRGLIKTYKMNSKTLSPLLLLLLIRWNSRLPQIFQPRPAMQTTHKSHKFNVHVQQRIRTSYHIVPCLQEGFRILATLSLYSIIKTTQTQNLQSRIPSCIITIVIITATTTESSLWTSKIQEQFIYCPSWTIFFPRLLTYDTSWLPSKSMVKRTPPTPQFCNMMSDCLHWIYILCPSFNIHPLSLFELHDNFLNLIKSLHQITTHTNLTKHSCALWLH